LSPAMLGRRVDAWRESTVYRFYLTLLTIMPRCLLSGPVAGVLPGRVVLRIRDSTVPARRVGLPFGTLTIERDGLVVLDIRILEHFPGWFRPLAHEISTCFSVFALYSFTWSGCVVFAFGTFLTFLTFLARVGASLGSGTGIFTTGRKQLLLRCDLEGSEEMFC